jgi:MFS family permease
MDKETRKSLMSATVVVSALGYFVDIYDLVLFSIVRIASLRDLGVPDDQLLEQGVRLLNMQMIGMLLGGVLWGVLGDKLGRLSVLFGSILMYSLANLANGMTHSVEAYGWLRFIAGVGLAGELGAAITLVSESLPKQIRGYGTSLVAGVGVSGAMLAAVIGEAFHWRVAYIVGGVLGLLLLATRVKMLESGIFQTTKKDSKIKRGNLVMLFNSRTRFLNYARCIAIGLPIWFVIGILITFSPEICSALGATGPVSAGKGILFGYMGLAIGDIGSGLISQYFKSRKKALLLFQVATLVSAGLFLMTSDAAPETYYALCLLMGTACGYWAIFVTVAAEQFGTNLRATVATTVPNFVRGAVVPMTLMFHYLQESVGLIVGATLVGGVVLALSFVALWYFSESFDRDLDWIEH